MFKNLEKTNNNHSDYFSYQVYNKIIATDSELNNKLKDWFEQNKRNPNFNYLYFLDSKNITWLHDSILGYNYEPIEYVDNSAKLFTENLSGSSNSSSKYNKVYSFQVTLTPASGHGWTDGDREGKVITIFAPFSS
ncbi:hypothetical protein [Malacoplasma penetrans]|nr:hypothetical protein [Malacoplasma penetrans]